MNIDYDHIHSVPRNPREEVTRHHAACSMQPKFMTVSRLRAWTRDGARAA